MAWKSHHLEPWTQQTPNAFRTFFQSVLMCMPRSHNWIFIVLKAHLPGASASEQFCDYELMPVDGLAEHPMWAEGILEPSPRTRWCLRGCPWGLCLMEQTRWTRSRATSGIHTHRCSLKLAGMLPVQHHQERPSPQLPKRKSVSSRVHEAVKAIALCHNMTPVYEPRAGVIAEAEYAEVDQDFSDGNRTYQAASPDEIRRLPTEESAPSKCCLKMSFQGSPPPLAVWSERPQDHG
ncbi:uncharacterized protein LOC113933925 isoform X2 [Zalophus californianus]|uniref:Uncharacterized protein LOC113933925 isoform X2 n=1 Tax=Zalophus californianus TaxID=9704 RepID=A0A6P9FHZ9_ZALCA|nr:uncharacterized protein LOC113933925 isoform X2 [Zalophus californianus]